VLSLGYGRTPHGRMLHQFGAVGEPGGAQLLLSAVTRARDAMVVVCGFGIEDLDLTRLKSPGSRALRDVLTTAAAGGVPQEPTVAVAVDISGEASPDPGAVEPSRPGSPKADAAGPAGRVELAGGAERGGPGERGAPAAPAEVESTRQRAGLDALLEDFALRLEADGLSVERSVPVGASARGDESAPPPIDLVVRDEESGRRVAVESDGPTYAALASVRERDRMRAERLARLGFEQVRVWSTDIFRDPAREVSRVRRALFPAGEEERPEGSTAVSSVSADSAAGQRRATRALEETSPEQSGPEQTGPEQTAPEQTGPEQTKDDTDLGWGEVPPSGDAHDDWLREQRPPHWE
jgi:hypothetical protein